MVAAFAFVVVTTAWPHLLGWAAQAYISVPQTVEFPTTLGTAFGYVPSHAICISRSLCVNLSAIVSADVLRAHRWQQTTIVGGVRW